MTSALREQINRGNWHHLRETQDMQTVIALVVHFMNTIDQARLFPGTAEVQCLFEALDHILTAVNENAKKQMVDKDDKIEQYRDDQQYVDVEESLQRDLAYSLSKGNDLPIWKDTASNAIEASHSRRTLPKMASVLDLEAQQKEEKGR